jgi:hypothetical protein
MDKSMPGADFGDIQTQKFQVTNMSQPCSSSHSRATDRITALLFKPTQSH